MSKNDKKSGNLNKWAYIISLLVQIGFAVLLYYLTGNFAVFPVLLITWALTSALITFFINLSIKKLAGKFSNEISLLSRATSQGLSIPGVTASLAEWRPLSTRS